MAADPFSRDGLLAGAMLNALRRLEEGGKRLLQLARADRQHLQREMRALIPHLAAGVVSNGPLWNAPAAIPIRDEAPTGEKATARETAGARPTLRVPDVVQVITAYRAWRVGLVKGQVRLFALGLEVTWEPRQKAEAECNKALATLGLSLSRDEAGSVEHEAPDFYCRCGIWGFKSLENLLSALRRRYKPSVIGKVSLWGRVIETENGYRAQYAYPEELWARSAGFSAEELGLVYGVPVRTP